MTFENHTACECVGRNSDVMPRTEPVLTEPRNPHWQPPGSPDDRSTWVRSYHDQVNRENGESHHDEKMHSDRHHRLHHQEKPSETSSRGDVAKSGRKRQQIENLHHALGRVATTHSSDRIQPHPSFNPTKLSSQLRNFNSKYAITCINKKIIDLVHSFSSRLFDARLIFTGRYIVSFQFSINRFFYALTVSRP